MNANDLARMSVCHHLPRLCISTSQLPRCCVENGRLGRSRQLPAPTLQPWPTSCLNSSCDMLLLHCYIAQAPESLCLNVTSSIVTLIFRAQVHTSLQTLGVSQWQQFCRSLKCFEDHRSATVLLLEHWNKILPSPTRPEASLEEQERAVLKPVRGSEFIRECQVPGRAKLRKCIWYDLTYRISSILVWTSWCTLYDRRVDHVWKQWSPKSKTSGTWWL